MYLFLALPYENRILSLLILPASKPVLFVKMERPQQEKKALVAANREFWK